MLNRKGHGSYGGIIFILLGIPFIIPFMIPLILIDMIRQYWFPNIPQPNAYLGALIEIPWIVGIFYLFHYMKWSYWFLIIWLTILGFLILCARTS